MDERKTVESKLTAVCPRIKMMQVFILQELCQTAVSILKIHDFSREAIALEPCLLTTSHLKLAYIFKANDFRGRGVLEPTGIENCDNN